MRLVEGQLIHRRYRLDKRLAQGGMGEVWKAHDWLLNRPVAIKALRADTADAEVKLLRLRTEAHNSANLAHPNIAALFEYYEHDGIGFLIMEYVPSRTLAEIYKEKGVLRADELLPILIQTARGLYVAHSHGVVHRDVKPANIMVSDDGEVKITDFGVSYSANQEQITQDGMVVGTAQYISPEQAQGQQATAQSDIYSLGVVMYEGLCGHRPFTGATAVDIASAHVNDSVPPLPDTVDLQLAQFVMAMLEKDPADRPADALVVSRTLQHIERRLLDKETQVLHNTEVSNLRSGVRVVSSRLFTDVPMIQWYSDNNDRIVSKNTQYGDINNYNKTRYASVRHANTNLVDKHNDVVKRSDELDTSQRQARSQQPIHRESEQSVQVGYGLNGNDSRVNSVYRTNAQLLENKQLSDNRSFNNHMPNNPQNDAHDDNIISENVVYDNAQYDTMRYGNNCDNNYGDKYSEKNGDNVDEHLNAERNNND